MAPPPARRAGFAPPCGRLPRKRPIFGAPGGVNDRDGRGKIGVDPVDLHLRLKLNPTNRQTARLPAPKGGRVLENRRQPAIFGA